MAERPYLLIKQAVLAGEGTGTISHTVSNQEKLWVHEIFQQATGTFNITDIKVSRGNHYTNAGLTVEIPSVLIASGANGYNHIGKFPVPLYLAGGATLTIDLEDSSSAGNTVELIMVCTQEYGP